LYTRRRPAALRVTTEWIVQAIEAEGGGEVAEVIPTTPTKAGG